MTPVKRDWTREEIEGIVLKTFSLQLEKLADGAQASINGLILMAGDPALGIKGVFPEMMERLGQVESRLGKVEGQVQRQQHTQDERDQINSGRFDSVEATQKRIEMAQHRVRRLTRALYEWSLKKEDGKPNYWRLVTVASAMGAGFHVASLHVPSWTTLKLFAAKWAVLMK